LFISSAKPPQAEAEGIWAQAKDACVAIKINFLWGFKRIVIVQKLRKLQNKKRQITGLNDNKKTACIL
jgi:hypothetical protein